jgi:hypothetical protein
MELYHKNQFILKALVMEYKAMILLCEDKLSEANEQIRIAASMMPPDASFNTYYANNIFREYKNKESNKERNIIDDIREYNWMPVFAVVSIVAYWYFFMR